MSRGATALDAAFHIHTDVGLHAVGANINGKEVQFSYELQNGDLVDIQTSPDATPQTDWLRWAHRRSTKTKLKTYFKARERLALEQSRLRDQSSFFSPAGLFNTISKGLRLHRDDKNPPPKDDIVVGYWLTEDRNNATALFS